MTKDRLAKLLESQMEQNGSNGRTSTVVVEMGDNDFMSVFFRKVNEIRRMVTEIERCVRELKVKQSNALANTQDNLGFERNMEELMATIKRMSNSVRLKLKELEQEVEAREKETNDMTSADARIRRCQYSAAFRQFINVMKEYHRNQSAHRERCKAQIQRKLEVGGQSISDSELEDLLEQDKLTVFAQQMDEMELARQSVIDYEAIQARHAVILKLERSIQELRDMFVDIAILVEEQGDLIDRVEDNVNNAIDAVASAKKNLQSAVKYSKKARRKKIIIIGIVVGILLVLALIIGLSVGL